MNQSKIEKILMENYEKLGIHEFRILGTDKINFSGGTRIYCEENFCGKYSKNWACPPGVGIYEDCVAECLSYKNVCVFTTVTDLKGENNYKGWDKARVIHELITEKITLLFREYYKKVLTLSTEGCTFCEKCTYPNFPCPYPERLFPSVEGYGVIVMDIAKKAEINYLSKIGTITYFSLILF